MMSWIYDLGFLVFGIFSLPRFLGKMEQAEDRNRLIRERFGFFSPDSLSGLDGKRPLWIHCVSVGEALAVEKFVRLILERKPRLSIILTTVTPTGQRIAKKWENERLKVFYFPFDLQFSVRRFFGIFNPVALFLVETEIWPNVIEEARRRKIPVGVINGRISERSFQAFRRFSFIFKPLLAGIDFFLVQTEKDRERLAALGVDPHQLIVTGNMKLDAFDLNGEWEKNRETLAEKWGFLPTDQILIGGSTHPGEEEILLRVFCQLHKAHPSLKLLLAPRHIERSPKILDLAVRQGVQAVLASGRKEAHSFEVLILDQLGELRRLYPIASAVVMGGSFIRHGGQNPVEPASCRRPIIHGPWVFNFEDLYHRLDEEGGSIRAAGEEELIFVLKRILASDRERDYLGGRAYEVLKKLQGATERNFKWIGEKYEFV